MVATYKKYNLQNLGYRDENLTWEKLGVNYTPFGVVQEGRNWEGTVNSTPVSAYYRYGFNGVEKDDEIKGTGNSYHTTFRSYDSRLGRWLSIDPLHAGRPYESTYAGFGNNPIYFVDPSGLTPTNGDDGGSDDEAADESMSDDGSYMFPEMEIKPEGKPTFESGKMFKATVSYNPMSGSGASGAYGWVEGDIPWYYSHYITDPSKQSLLMIEIDNGFKLGEGESHDYEIYLLTEQDDGTIKHEKVNSDYHNTKVLQAVEQIRQNGPILNFLNASTMIYGAKLVGDMSVASMEVIGSKVSSIQLSASFRSSLVGLRMRVTPINAYSYSATFSSAEAFGFSQSVSTYPLYRAPAGGAYSYGIFGLTSDKMYLGGQIMRPSPFGVGRGAIPTNLGFYSSPIYSPLKPYPQGAYYFLENNYLRIGIGVGGAAAGTYYYWPKY